MPRHQGQDTEPPEQPVCTENKTRSHPKSKQEDTHLLLARSENKLPAPGAPMFQKLLPASQRLPREEEGEKRNHAGRKRPGRNFEH